MNITKYDIKTEGLALCAALVADFHNGDPSPLLNAVRELSPDVILVAGDVVHDGERMENGLTFLREATRIAPVFCVLGNHEKRCGEQISRRIAETGAQLLDDRFVRLGGAVIGGLTSGSDGVKRSRLKKTAPPKTEWLDQFCAEEGVKILLSHHPEYYMPFLAHRPIDLILSGHAHGGQWRFFGQGVFAPGQGFFPRFTSGVYRGKRRCRGPIDLSEKAALMLVSRGLYNHTWIPRILNSEELIVLSFEK